MYLLYEPIGCLLKLLWLLFNTATKHRNHFDTRSYLAGEAKVPKVTKQWLATAYHGVHPPSPPDKETHIHRPLTWKHVEQRAPSECHSIAFQSKINSSGLVFRILKLRFRESKTLAQTRASQEARARSQPSIWLSLRIVPFPPKGLKIKVNNLLPDP